MEIDGQTAIVFGSALAAALSFIAFALPFLNRTERKARIKEVIEKRKRDLFQAATQSIVPGAHKSDEKSLSAQESLAMFYKVQELAGEMGEKVRDQMLQAGNRDPRAPLKFIMARALLPFFFAGISMMFISASEEEISDSLTLLIIFGAAGFGFYLPQILIKNQIIKRQEEIGLTFPDALDMMLICVQGGIGLEQTIDRVAEEMAESSPLLAEELGILSAEMSMLNDRRAALQDFARRVGSGAARNFATAMVQAEQYGTSVSQAMRVMAEDLRDQRMQEAERKAMALPPKLTVPMILFFLPSLFVVILGPVGVQIAHMNL